MTAPEAYLAPRSPETYLAPRSPERGPAPRRRAPVTMAVGGVLAAGLVVSSTWAALATLSTRQVTVAARETQGLRGITIDVDAADVIVSTGSVDRPVFTYTLPWTAADDAFRQSTGGVILTARLRTSTFPIQFPWSMRPTVALMLPASGVESLVITTGSGSITASVEAASETLTTQTGSIDVKGHVVAVTAVAGTGAVHVRALDAQSVSASAASGSLDLHLTGAPPTLLHAETGTGSILVEVPAGRYAVDAEAGTGHVADDLVKDDTSPNVIRASTGTGSIALRHS